MTVRIDEFINGFADFFPEQHDWLPWDITKNLQDILILMISQLNNDFETRDNIAIHKSARVEYGAVIKGPVIICEDCFIGAHAYLREGVYAGKSTTIGPGCEIKTSIILNNTSTSHFNFIGDSIVGKNVNFEAGSIIANHYNERTDKKIRVVHQSQIIQTHSEKFGALVGDHSCVGANAVLSPGTLLPPNTIVKRLELVDQLTKIES
jgi:NDP-sugar pyrophosphorylase family protein